MPHRRDQTAWLQGGTATCLTPPTQVHRTWRLVLIGPPGCGKGTQAGLLGHALGACPLSTGELFRAASDHAPPGSQLAAVHDRMARGDLIDDETVLALIRERGRCLHCRGGFTLDGFPRTLAQATALDELLAAEQVPLDAVVSYEVSAEEITARLSGRRLCATCHRVFHLRHSPPRTPDRCDDCGGTLVQREDDQPAAISHRLEAYTAATAPVIAHYERNGLLVRVPAHDAPVEILARTLDQLAQRLGPA